LTDQRTKLPFSFANYADDFDHHIERSIRGYSNLIEDCVELSQYFVENGTVFCDIGCATGRTLAAIRARNQERAPDAVMSASTSSPVSSSTGRNLPARISSSWFRTH
jgi:hypothetical protein